MPTRDLTANDDFAVTLMNNPVDIDVLENDTSEGRMGVERFMENPSNGAISLQKSGTVLYTPTSFFVGIDTFVYEVCDYKTERCKFANVTVDVWVS